MGFFTNIKDTQASNKRGTFLTEGEHTLSVARVKMVESKKNNATYFCVEANVEDSTSDNHRAGQLITWLVKMGGEWPEYALADIKAFVMSASGAPEDEIDDTFMDAVLANDGDLLGGKLVDCSVNVVETKRGGEFNKHSWSPHSDA